MKFSPLALSLAFIPLTLVAAEPPLAFPGAEGYGRFATGGRGGEVYAVTNLNDAGPGSLRDALSASNRTIVFRVSGTIDLESDLVIAKRNITIAGQTAPGDGICLRGHSLRLDGASDVIVRFLRVRPGPQAREPLDGIEVRNSHDVMLDHCSVSWTIDEAVNTWHGVKNVTIQWCLVSEPLNRSVHPKGAHGYGASLGAENGSYHHNLFASATARNPSVAGNRDAHTINMDFRCNVIFNWQHRTCDGKPVSCNVVNNYFKPGPATLPSVRHRIVRIDDTQSAYGYPSHWFIAGNFVEGAPEISADNWRGGVDFENAKTSATANRSREPFPFAPVTTQPPAEACELVLAQAGATRPRRDAVDARVIDEVRSGKPAYRDGIIDSPAQVGGWPELKSAIAPADSDHDGMPDDWETANHLDPRDPADRNAPLPDGMTQLERYLNSRVG